MRNFKLISFILILLIGLSCARNEDSFKDYTVAGSKGGIDKSRPSIISVAPTESSSFVSLSPSISFTFSEEMDPNSIISNTTNTNCSGTIQLSNNDFSTCVIISSQPTGTNNNTTFSISPKNNLSNTTNYKFKITTLAKDLAGNNMNNQYLSSSGFKTIPLMKWYEGSTGGWTSSGATPGQSGGSSGGAGGGCSYNYTRTTFQSGTKYIAQSLNPTISINPSYIGVGLTQTCPDNIIIKNDSGGSPNTTLKTIPFSAITFNTITIKDSSGNIYHTEGTCTTSISSSDGYTFSSGTTYWLVFEYTSTPTSLQITDMSSSTTNSNVNIKHSTNGSSWTTVPIYNFTQENPSNCYNRSSLSYTKRMKLFLAE